MLAKLFKSKAIEHSRDYFEAFFEKLLSQMPELRRNSMHPSNALTTMGSLGHSLLSETFAKVEELTRLGGSGVHVEEGRHA